MKKISQIIYRRLITVLSITLLTFGIAMAQNAGDSEAKEKKVYPPGSAWTLSWPLGSHIESTMDTVLYNYQRQFIQALTSDAWATTGQFSGPGIDMIYFNRAKQLEFLPAMSIEKWVPTFARQKFYNMYIPYTQLSYNVGYSTEARTDLLKATFAGNVNRKIGIGAWMEYPYTKAYYTQQSAKALGYGINGYYTGSRYDFQGFFNHYNHLNKENGGITDDRYVTNPAELQGGVSDIEPRSIPVRLSGAYNRVQGLQFYMNHAYKLGFWRDITQPEDTVEREEFVPVTKIIYSFDWKKDSHNFVDKSSNQSYWDNVYFDRSKTDEFSRYWSISNTVGVQMVEGFQKWAKFGLSVYATHMVDKYGYEIDGMQNVIAADDAAATPSDSEDDEIATDSGLTTLPTDWRRSMGKVRNHFWVGGRIEKTRGSIVRYSADAKFGLAGVSLGDIDVAGNIETRFRLGKDTVRISADANFSNLEPNYMLNHYVGNHFIWNNDFGKIRKFGVKGRLHIPWSRTDIFVGFENIQNQVYFNSECLPRQYAGHIQIFSAAIQQNLKFGIWNWNNTVTYQTTSKADIMPLPMLTVYSNMFLNFRIFKVLDVQFGVDCNYYTKYTGYDWQPATMTFHVQGEDAVKVGNFINTDVYLTCKLKKVRFFLMCTHLNQGWFGRNYFTLPHYPLDPRQFRFGLSIDFVN